MTTFLRRHGLRLTGAILLAWVLFTTDLKEAAAALAGVSPARIGAIALLAFSGLCLKGWRWERLLRSLGVDLPPARVAAVGVYSIALGFLSPGRVAELAKVAFLKREAGLSLAVGTFSVVADRILDLFILLLVLVTTAVYFVREASLAAALLTGALAALAGVFALALVRRFLPRSLAAATAPSFRAGVLSRVAGISLAATVIHIGQNTLLARELGLDLSFWQVAFAVSLAAVVSLLPVTVMGIGTREVALIFALGLFGISRPAALSFSLLVFTVHLVVFLSTAAAGSIFLPPLEGRGGAKGSSGDGEEEFPEGGGGRA